MPHCKAKKSIWRFSGITINDKRKQTYDFSIPPYFESTYMIMVKENSPIKNALDLKGKTIGVQNGTTGQAAVEKLLGKENKNIKKFENTVVAIMDLFNGGVEAVVTDNAVASEYVKNNPDKKIKTIADPEHFESEFYGLMFPKGSDLKPKVTKRQGFLRTTTAKSWSSPCCFHPQTKKNPSLAFRKG